MVERTAESVVGSVRDIFFLFCVKRLNAMKAPVDTTLFERVQAPIRGENNLKKEKWDRGVTEKRKKTKLKKDKMISFLFMPSWVP